MKELQQTLLDMCKHYPKASLTDYVKLIYQNEFGCEHFAPAPDVSLEYIRTELETALSGRTLFENIGNGYKRLYLKNAVDAGASPTLINRMFLSTVGRGNGFKDHFISKLSVLHQLCQEGKLPITESLYQLYMLNYQAAGYPSVHHSPDYRAAYAPAYRVVHEDYARFFEIMLQIDRMLQTDTASILVAIDGPCASGKTTLSSLMETCFDCNIFHTDDFYLRPEQRTAERYSEPGGNMDRERLREQVLSPLKACHDVLYRPYSCTTQTVEEGRMVPYQRLNIIEGSYSLHPELRCFYDIKVVLKISEDHQMSRLKRRESQKSLKMFRERWIPYENNYAEASNLYSAADILFEW